MNEAKPETKIFKNRFIHQDLINNFVYTSQNTAGLNIAIHSKLNSNPKELHSFISTFQHKKLSFGPKKASKTNDRLRYCQKTNAFSEGLLELEFQGSHCLLWDL